MLGGVRRKTENSDFLGPEHTDPLLLTGAQRTFNSFEDLHDGFRVIPKGNDHTMHKALVRASVYPVFI